MDEKKYWPALPTGELGTKLAAIITSNYANAGVSSHTTRMRKALESYYGMSNDVPSHEIIDAGEVGELSLINVNYGRYLVQHLLSVIGGTRVAYKAIPNNTDVRSRQQAIVANGLLAAYARDLRLERIFYSAAESAIVTSEGFVRVIWDPRATDAEGVPDSGDLRVEAFTPLDIIRDISCRTSKPQWYIVREYLNRYDLAERFPECSTDILDISPNSTDLLAFYRYESFSRLTGDGEDYIPVYTFYHDRTEAMSTGREVLFLTNGKILTSGPLAYKSLPIYRMAPADVMGLPIGYTPFFDALSAIEAYNALQSTILSNQFALGTQKVWSQKGDDLDVRQLSTGLVNIQTSGPKPEPLNLVQSAPELFQSKEDHRGVATLLMGLNDTSLGIQTQRLSGNAMALLDQKTSQFATPFHESYNHLVESVGQAILETLQTFAASPRVGRMIGKNNAYMLKSFSAEDLGDINRVTVEVVDPAFRSFAVRQQQADTLLNAGMIKTKEEYISAMESGQLEIETDGAMAERNLILQENEMLSLGEKPVVIDTDEHVLHILKHKAILANPEARSNPEIVIPTLEHLGEHIEALRSVDPELLQILGQQPSQMNQQLLAMQTGAPDAPNPANVAAQEAPLAPQDGAPEEAAFASDESSDQLA